MTEHPTTREWGQINDVWKGRLRGQKDWGSSNEVTAMSVALGWMRREVVNDLFTEAFGPELGREMRNQVHDEISRLWTVERERMKAVGRDVP